nr:[Asn1,Val5]angiotensin II [Amphiuma tridactylum=three-toed amphiumas, plasma, Peptide, 8 aa] [Amphiuma tridactylum]
NRVYVHPF